MIADYCKELKCLKLTGLTKAVDDTGLSYLNHTAVEDLDISLCTNITDAGINNLTEQSKYIRLNITGLIYLTNNSLKTLISNNCRTLTDLTIALMPQKDVNNELTQFIAKCKNLVNINLEGCINFTNDGIYSIITSGLTKLETINFSGIQTVDDNLATSCMSLNKELKTLRLSNCPLLTNYVLDHIINSSTNLLVLEINRTPLIKDEKIEEALKAKSPNLRIIRSTNLGST